MTDVHSGLFYIVPVFFPTLFTSWAKFILILTEFTHGPRIQQVAVTGAVSLIAVIALKCTEGAH